MISIITVCYNAEKEIETTLKSVAEQAFQDYEHIIVDGASKDNTLSIVTRYATEKTCVFSKPDSGIYHGMNRGLQMAKGDYVLFLNAGDRFADTDVLKRYAEGASMGADIIYGDTVIVDASGEILRPRHLSAPEELSYESYLRGMLICHQAFMVRRALAPRFSRKFKLSADYDWCLKCIKTSKKSCNLHMITIHYLDGGLSQKNKIVSLRERFLIMKNRFGLFPTLKAHLSFIPRSLARHIKK